jgi:hypothetical protein
MALVPQLSAYEDTGLVDHLYQIDTATPVSDPVFVFLVGSPGAGKSQGHYRLRELGVIPADGDYATINMDTLLESLLPFRAASSIGHLLKRELKDSYPEDAKRFASIFGYSTKKENAGMFDWYDGSHNTLAAAAPNTVRRMNRVREQFLPLKGAVAPKNLVDINSHALARAIQKSINIVYETTFALNNAKKVAKFMDIMSFLKNHPHYKVIVAHMAATVPDVQARLRGRQEYEMPYKEVPPFYRYVSTSDEKVAKYIKDTADAVAHLQKTYESKGVVFVEFENALDPARLPAPVEFNAKAQSRKILNAYGRRATSSHRKTSSKKKTSSSHRKTSSKKERV